MDPNNPASFFHRKERLSTGRTYHFVDQLPEEFHSQTTTLLCIHGFPDLWYGWRYQVKPWVQLGFRVVVPTMLGYGDTDRPADPGEYTTKKLCADLIALLDLLGVEKAVVIGHDWGSFIASRMALWHPTRLLALVLMSIPYTPPLRRYITVQEIAHRLPNLKYQVYFSDPSFTPEVEAALLPFLGAVFLPPGNDIKFTDVSLWPKIFGEGHLPNPPSVLTPQEMNYYYSQLKKGMTGPLNYYRTSQYRFDEETANLPSLLPSDLSVLFLWGTSDPAAMPIQVDNARKFVPRLRDVALEGRGHWIMVEAKDEVTDTISSWLGDLGLISPQKPKL
ncbi:Alpha/Beta hydrolase protein [Desarmillaria tabescens]|uniref:Alpha/Beta hydrolase protein n=1 Tax=Armillaria tabescens TaxID=1929756 RepID=A0AA39NA01_ARMTA|nr:Alpha/Beta hydrolase protein [Desarmillaria tabescens]KAK0461777.1 Alpha/Beta hydrolase protein [Desarmillaria tabescens]